MRQRKPTYSGQLWAQSSRALGWRLLRTGAEKAEDDAGGGPVIVLGGRAGGTKSGAVVVHVDQANFPVSREVEVDAASGFVGNAVEGSFESARAGDGGVEAGTADERFHKGRQTEAAHVEAAIAIVDASTEMVAVQHGLSTGAGGEIVAAVAHQLEPGLEVPSKGAQAAGEVGRGSGTREAVERIAAIEFHQELLMSASHGLFPALACFDAANGLRRRLRGFRLRLRSRSGLCGSWRRRCGIQRPRLRRRGGLRGRGRTGSRRFRGGGRRGGSYRLSACSRSGRWGRCCGSWCGRRRRGS